MNFQDKIDKWFIDTNKKSFPPTHRIKGSKLKDYTVGNKVDLLLDGANLMAEFHKQLEEINNSPDILNYELWISAMNIQSVKLLGNSDKNGSLKTRLLDLADKGVKIRYLGGGHPGVKQLSTKFGKKLVEHGAFGTADFRSGFEGGQHQKFTVLIKPDKSIVCTLGSADFFKANWDRPGHKPKDTLRPTKNPVHNLSVRIEGPATHDIALTFAERWNDMKTNNLTKPPIVRKVKVDFLRNKPEVKGPHAIQVLRTYGMNKGKTYSFANKGEFTVWASYINAIKNAKRYIYIEDQYMYPFGMPPLFESGTKKEKESDIIYQLGEAIKRGVDVICLAPSRDNSFAKQYEIRHRQRGGHYLDSIAKQSIKYGLYVLATIRSGKIAPNVHSKVMLIDDELSLIGSTNIGQIAMTAVSESHVAILDKENKFTLELRQKLWREHMDLPNKTDLKNITKSINKFYRFAKDKKGNLDLLSVKPVEGNDRHKVILKKLEPYRGPSRK